MIERELIAGIDYYLEDEKMVFTAQYLRDRGYCCTSGCRHCPYGFEREEAAATSDDRKPHVQE